MEITLKIIELIKSYPVLYNTKHPLFSHRLKRDQTWEVAAKKLKISAPVLKSKWRNIRDGYIKHLRSLTTKYGKTSKCYIKWPWAAHMEFFKPYAYVNGPRNRSWESPRPLEGDTNADDSNLNLQFNDQSNVGDDNGDKNMNNPGNIENTVYIKTDYDVLDDASFNGSENSGGYGHINDNQQMKFGEIVDDSCNGQIADDISSREPNENVNDLPLELEILDCHSTYDKRNSRRLTQERDNSTFNSETLQDLDGIGCVNDDEKRRYTDPLGVDQFGNSYHPMTNNDLDAIELLFLSYAKTVKTFSPRRQVMTKMKIHQVIMDAELNHHEESAANIGQIK